MTLYLLPALGPVKLRALHAGHVRAFLLQKAREGYHRRGRTKQDEGGGEDRREFSKNTLRLMRACLSAMFGAAVEEGILTMNPALLLGRRRRKRVDSISVTERQKRIRALSANQLTAFLDALKGAPTAYGALFATMARSGLRPGEAFALQPQDLDSSTD